MSGPLSLADRKKLYESNAVNTNNNNNNHNNINNTITLHPKPGATTMNTTNSTSKAPTVGIAFTTKPASSNSSNNNITTTTNSYNKPLPITTANSSTNKPAATTVASNIAG